MDEQNRPVLKLAIPGLSASDAIQELYRNEVNAGMQSEWGGGIVVWIGGPIVSEHSVLPPENISESTLPASLTHLYTPMLSRRVFSPDEFDEIAGWLLSEARRLFPDEFEQ